MDGFKTGAWLVAGLLIVAPGCYQGGSFDEDADPGDEGSDGMGETEGAALAFPAGLRRLTRDQLENAYRDVLLDPDLMLGDRLPTDPSTDEDFKFDTERTGLSTFGGLDIIKLDSVAISAVGDAFELASPALLPCEPGSADDDCARGYIDGMLSRAFRRPPTDEEVEQYVGLAVQTQMDLGDPLQGLEFATATALQSPYFLYLSELGEGEEDEEGTRQLSNHELAARLSFFLWNAPPDSQLRALADEGRLTDDDVLAGEVERLLSDQRGQDAMLNFFRQWIGYEGLATLSKNSGVYPEFSPDLAAAMGIELDRALVDIVGGAPYGSLFTSNKTWVTPALASFYGLEIPGGEGDDELLEHFEAEDQGQGCNTENVPPEFHNLCSEGPELRYEFVATDAPVHRVTVRAYATQGGDELTRMRVTVGADTVELDVSATADAPDTYSVPLSLEPGQHEVVVQLANDFFEPPENRDLMVDWVEIHAGSADPTAVFEVDLPEERAGLLSRAGVLAVYAKAIDTSPTTRGLFVRQRLLCQTVPDPPPGVPTDLPPFSDDIKTNRERVELHTADPVCAGCHQFIDPIGLALEHYDGIGKYREDHDGTPLDVSGDLDGIEFDGAIELGAVLADDPRIPECAMQQLSRFALGMEETQQQREAIWALSEVLQATGSWSDAVEALVLSDLFTTVGPSREED